MEVVSDLSLGPTKGIFFIYILSHQGLRHFPLNIRKTMNSLKEKESRMRLRKRRPFAFNLLLYYLLK